MLTEIHQPHHLSPSALDTYLERGWFRMGQMIFTCSYLCFHNELFSAVWTRLPLDGQQFGKRRRKLLRRNNERFRTIIRKAIFDDEKELLYQKHCERFEGFVAHTLKDSLFGDAEYNIFDTYEVCVFDGDQMVAVSFFDMGSESMASIMGLFDPEYSRYSLGLYTMLVEIFFGRQHQKKYYYPGYVVPGYQRFDYKRKIGALEHYDCWQKSWQPISEIVPKQQPAERLSLALHQIKDALLQKDIASELVLYPLYDKQLFGLEEGESVRSPLILSAYHQEHRAEWQIVEYDQLKEEYYLSEVIKIEDASALIFKLFEEYDLEQSCLNFLVREKVVLRSSSVEKIVEALQSGYPQYAVQY